MLPTLATVPRLRGIPDEDKQQRTMKRKAFTKLVHQMEQSRVHHGLLMRFVCQQCDMPVSLRRGAPILVRPERAALETAVDVDTDAFTLVCACSIVTVEAGK